MSAHRLLYLYLNFRHKLLAEYFMFHHHVSRCGFYSFSFTLSSCLIWKLFTWFHLTFFGASYTCCYLSGFHFNGLPGSWDHNGGVFSCCSFILCFKNTDIQEIELYIVIDLFFAFSKCSSIIISIYTFGNILWLLDTYNTKCLEIFQFPKCTLTYII